MKSTKILSMAVAGLMLMAMSSCRKDLCYNHFRTAAVSLSWEQEWERDYGMAHAANWDEALHGLTYDDMRPELPELVTLVTYSDEASPRETFLPVEGDDVGVDGLSGTSFLLYNNDTEYIVLADMASLAEARATSTSRSRSTIEYLTQIHPGVRSTNPPDVLYASFVEKVPFIDLHESRHLPVTMQPLVYTYIIRYEFEYGIHHVAIARGALGGMAESVYLRSGATSAESSIILFDCDVKSYGCEAHVRSFGIPAFPDEYYGRAATSRADEPYTLNLELRLTNGKTVEFNYDIADQILAQPRGGVIRVSGIRIEDEENLFNSGFDVEVDDWGEHEDIDLPVGVF